MVAPCDGPVRSGLATLPRMRDMGFPSVINVMAATDKDITSETAKSLDGRFFTRSIISIMVIGIGLSVVIATVILFALMPLLKILILDTDWNKLDILMKVFGVFSSMLTPLAIFYFTIAYQRDEFRLRSINTAVSLSEDLFPEQKDRPWYVLGAIGKFGDKQFAEDIARIHMRVLIDGKHYERIQQLMKHDSEIIAKMAQWANECVYRNDEEEAKKSGKIIPGEDLVLNYYVETVPVFYNGKVTFEDKNESYGRWLTTQPSRTLKLRNEFRMGRYPVTNELFSKFVQDGGYRNLSFWHPMSHAVLHECRCQDHISYGPSTWPSEKGCPSGQERHPVAGICYYEAWAFCKWLQLHKEYRQSGWRWCLPTEDMWEFTARTEEKRSYPWGHDFKNGCCNSIESSVGTTSDVSGFSAGKSRDGCYDMAGNVWEFVDLGDEVPWSCVLHGGSFRNSQYEVRSYLRLHGVPRNHRPPDFGFRCAQLPEAHSAAREK